MKVSKHNFMNIFLAFGSILLVFHISAQSSITIDASQNMTNFKFINSSGEQDMNYSPAYSGSYNIGYRYTTDFGLFGGVRLGMRGAGATTIIDEANYSWSLQYLNTQLDLGYQYELGSFSPYLMFSPYFGYLVRANQTLNHQNFDIRNSGDLETVDFGLFISPGVNFKANDVITVFSQFNYMLGLQNLETVENQRSYNTLMGLTLGVSFSIQ
jgi:hypothetical protein